MGVSYDFSDFEKQLEKELKEIEKREKRALNKAADYLVKELKITAKDTFTKTGRGRGDLANSIKKYKYENHGVVVFPQGDNSKGQRNGEVGAVQEYGRSNMPGTAWFSSTVERCEPKIMEIIKEEMQRE